MGTVPTEALTLIRRWEGLRLNAYLCPAGIWTIGYGHTSGVLKGMVWTKEQAEEALSLDAEAAMKAVMRMTPGIADDTLKLAAITDFVFNLGPGRLQASTLRRRINAGQYEQVPDELRKWVWGGGKKLPGLIMRREDEVRLWQTTPVEA